MATKVKVEVEKPVFCVVEAKNARGGTQPRYRTVIYKNIKNKAITIENLQYSLVESEEMKPSINAHAFRTFCDKQNAQHDIEQGIKAKADAKAREEERAKNWKANQAKREEER
ncbi:MAG: hypothetical protein ACRDKE_11315, partial [Solirubrobacterales bacterium]